MIRMWHVLFAALMALWIFAPFSPLAAQEVPTLSAKPKPPPTNKGAPGPIVGVGLPFLVLAGGAYWLARRRESRANDE